jgi:hypothetical protein
MTRCTYLLPFRRTDASDAELAALAAYTASLAAIGCEVLVVDGSPRRDFTRHARVLPPAVRHVAVDPRWQCLNGKVNGVLTGMALASSESVILADDDVVYRPADVDRMCRLLEAHDLIVPQNHFAELPWWSRIETGRILINRALRPAGDYPGTFGVRRSTFARIGPYDGDVLFENEQMRVHFVRNRARVHHARGFFVARRAPSLRKWREQRLRQAYEDLDLLPKTLLFVALLPIGLALSTVAPALAAAYAALIAGAATGLALVGRAGATDVVPVGTCLTAPLWVVERALMVWPALWARFVTGGCRYGNQLIARGMRGAAAA